MRSTHPGPETGNNSIEIVRGDTPFVSNWLDLQIDNFHIVKPLGPTDPMLTSLNQPLHWYSHFTDDGRTANDPRHLACGLPGLWAHSVVAVPAGAPHGQVLPAVHLLDRGRLGVQTHRPGRGENLFILLLITLSLWIRMNILAQQIRECAIYKLH